MAYELSWTTTDVDAVSTTRCRKLKPSTDAGRRQVRHELHDVGLGQAGFLEVVLLERLDVDRVASAVVLDQLQLLGELAQLEEAAVAAVAARLSPVGVLLIQAEPNNVGVGHERLDNGKCRELGVELRRRDLDVVQVRGVLDLDPQAPRSFTTIERRLVVRDPPVDNTTID